MTKPRNTSAITIFSFQNARASAITPTTTSVATKVRRAVSAIVVDILAVCGPLQTRAQERHGVQRSDLGDDQSGRTGLPRGAPAQRRPRAPPCPRARARRIGWGPAHPALGAADPRRAPRRSRRADAAARGLGLGDDAPGSDDRQDVRDQGEPPAALGGGAPAGAPDARGGAEPSRATARLRDDRGGAAGARSRAQGAQRLPPGRAAGRLMPAPPLEVRGLTKRYGSTTAVDDLTFAVPAGRVTGFL